jgi:hypothetical protein
MQPHGRKAFVFSEMYTVEIMALIARVTLRLTVSQYVLVSSTLVGQSQSHSQRVTLRLTVSQSVSMSWCRAHFVNV